MTDEIVLRTPTAAEFPRFIAPLSIAFNASMNEAQIENELRTIELDRFVAIECPPGAVGRADAFFATVQAPSNTMMF